MKKPNRLICVLLPFVLLVVSLYSGFSTVAVSYPAVGRINGTSVRMRTSPSTTSGDNIICVLQLNETVTVTGEATDSSGDLWYAVTLPDVGHGGYVYGEYVTIVSYASDNLFGTVNEDGTRVRNAPGTRGTTVYATAPFGTQVQILGSELDSDGDNWYHVKITVSGNAYDGYMFGDYITVQAKYTTDAQFEELLSAQGFPESYKEPLRQLHAQYPSWVFVGENLSMTFSDALAAESQPFRNLVSSYSPKSWFLMQNGTYNFDNNTYVSGDSGGWYAVQPDVVAYYLDPRTSLSAASIFQFVEMSYNAENHTKAALQTLLNGTFMAGSFPESGYDTYADVLIAAAKQYELSPFCLASMILQEQGTSGGGGCISGTVSGYEGYYNYLNVGAYQTSTMTAVQRGAWYASTGSDYGKPWNTRTKAIFGGAQYYVNNYIKWGQDTLYYKKFNVISSPYYSHQYMTNIQGAYSEGVNTKKAYSTILNQSLTFVIPIYKDMPVAASPYPVSSGNNNNYLDAISVSGYDLNPTFDRFNDSYELIVGSEKDFVEITAALSDSGASVSGTGKHTLQTGSNDITLTVTASSGRTRNYSLHIYRQPGETPEENPSVSNDVYRIADSYLVGVPQKTGVDVLKANLAIKNGILKVLDAAGKERSDYVGTGCTVQLLNTKSELYASYTVVVRGDVNGDGRISLTDLSEVQRHLLYLTDLAGARLKAADISGDGRVSITDLSKIQRHLLEIELISE